MITQRDKIWAIYVGYVNEMKNKEYHTVGTSTKSNFKISERGKIQKFNTQVHDWSHRSLTHKYMTHTDV